MKTYKIAFVGLGSIGKRHLKNLTDILRLRGDSFTIDAYRNSNNKEIPQEVRHLITNEFFLPCELSQEIVYDIVFVTNPTSKHWETIQRFQKNTKSFFIEKPIFDSTEIDISSLEKNRTVTSYVACPLRYNPVLQYVKNKVDLDKVYSARAISSSYLPDWRPGTDYRQCYSAHRDMGGGVGIDLIHEWDYLTFLFGNPQENHTIQSTVSHLEIDSDDIAVYIAKVNNTMIELHLDYFGRKSIRTLDLFMKDDTLHCDLLNGRIDFLVSGQSVVFKNERNDHQMKEMKHFLDIIDKKTLNDSDVAHALKVLKLAKGEKL